MSAPAPIALATSPDEVIPPSAITGTPCSDATWAMSQTAVTCGTPTPATTRVVQIDPGPWPDLQRVGARVDQRLGRLGGRDVPGDHLDVVRVLDRADDVEHAVRVAVRRVDDERVDLGVDEGRGALEGVGPDADGGGDAQAAALVLRRERVRLALGDVLDGDQALEATLEVDDRQLLDPVAAEDRLRLLERRARPAP